MKPCAILLSICAIAILPLEAIAQTIPLQASQVVDSNHSSEINPHQFDVTFSHSHFEPIVTEGAIADFGRLRVQIKRIGATDSLIFVEMVAVNQSFANPVLFNPEQGSVVVADSSGAELEVMASAFGSQSAPGSEGALLQPGQRRHITVVYPGARGQTNWNPMQVAGLKVVLFPEGGEAIALTFAEDGVEFAVNGGVAVNEDS